MLSRTLLLLTRTPLHIGAGASVGAIDLPVQRERHTGFPIIPASGQKGSFADQWPNEIPGEAGKPRFLRDKDGRSVRLTTKKTSAKEGAETKTVLDEIADSAWLFGSDTTDLPFAGSLIFGEARLLAFPIRSAKGCYAWITCPLMLQRAARDGVFGKSLKGAGEQEENKTLAALAVLKEPADEEAIFNSDGPLALGDANLRQIVLEEYCFKAGSTAYPLDLSKAISTLVDDALFQSIADRLVILSNGVMSHFATTACEIAQHVRINDETGTAEKGGLFTQENVPADTLFYSIVSAVRSRVPEGDLKSKADSDALNTFAAKIGEGGVFQFGGDASTGLGFCTVTLSQS
jgi:CRISPR-associated protein Cmr4